MGTHELKNVLVDSTSMFNCLRTVAVRALASQAEGWMYTAATDLSPKYR